MIPLQLLHGWKCQGCGQEIWAIGWDWACALHFSLTGRNFAECQRYHEWLAKLEAEKLPVLAYVA